MIERLEGGFHFFPGPPGVGMYKESHAAGFFFFFLTASSKTKKRKNALHPTLLPSLEQAKRREC